jgi:methylated-DNA-[protein]-cysteine S-methyltransferase
MSTMDTLLGPFSVIVDADGAVLAAGWTSDVDQLAPLIHPTLREPIETRREVGAASRAAVGYHRGELTAPGTVPVRQQGSEFLTAAWKALRDVAPGWPVSYTELASRAGNPQAVRAAAQACARNAAALYVPCHRVVRVGGSLGGFRWGLDVKRRLLVHEAPAA